MENKYLLHGANHIIKKPTYTIGNEYNDYGHGFYCTAELEMAKEWDCKQNTDGFINRYAFDNSNLNILDLLDGKHNILNRIALLLKYRTFHRSSETAIDARNYIIDNFAIELSDYDIVRGYRAVN